MVKRAIIIIVVNCCASLFAQDLQFSRNFEARKKSIPLAISNNHSSYFYVLRLNKVVHDLTIERRAKPSAEIIAFTPLKLDSVNAGWFDYEKLDYLFFEQDFKAYFLFVKTLNTKKTVYLKIIDTTGKSSGFIELASMEREASYIDFDFTYKKTNTHSILIVASKYGVNGITRRVALLFDTRLKKIVWTKKLPLEPSATESSLAFECNSQNELLYVQTKSKILGYESYYQDNMRYTIPVVILDSLFVVKWESNSDLPAKVAIELGGMVNLRNVFIFPKQTGVFLSLQGQLNYEDSVQLRILNTCLTNNDLSVVYSKTNYFTSTVKEQLTFYDGPQKEFYAKEHKLFKNYEFANTLYTVCERKENYYYKELLLWKTNTNNGELVIQKVIPRKIFFFKNRTRFKNIAEVMYTHYKDSIKIFVLENPSNYSQNPNYFTYKNFKKENGLWNSSLVAYSLKHNGTLEKRRVFKNSNFDLVPLHYEAKEQKDVVFYLTNNKHEKFAILQMYP